MILCKLILFRINLEVHFNMIILKSEPLSFYALSFYPLSLYPLSLYLFLSKAIFLLAFNPFQAPLAQDSRIA